MRTATKCRPTGHAPRNLQIAHALTNVLRGLLPSTGHEVVFVCYVSRRVYVPVLRWWSRRIMRDTGRVQEALGEATGGGHGLYRVG